MSATLPPPRGPSPLIPAAIVLGYALAMMCPGVRPAHAVDSPTAGFRIAVTACHGTTCRPIATPAPPRVIGGLYTCQARAALVADIANGLPPKQWTVLGLPGRDWSVRARCVRADGGMRA